MYTYTDIIATTSFETYDYIYYSIKTATRNYMHKSLLYHVTGHGL